MRVILILPALALSGCSTPSFQGNSGPDATEVQVAPAPPPSAVTVEQFDTTTKEDRAAAVADFPPGGAQPLGKTIASLGSPQEPGIWLKTPLVRDVTPGRVNYQGNRINVELRPSGGEPGSGSQISLAAMRLIEAPLTSLPELTVFGGL